MWFLKIMDKCFVETNLLKLNEEGDDRKLSMNFVSTNFSDKFFMVNKW